TKASASVFNGQTVVLGEHTTATSNASDLQKLIKERDQLKQPLIEGEELIQKQKKRGTRGRSKRPADMTTTHQPSPPRLSPHAAIADEVTRCWTWASMSWFQEWWAGVRSLHNSSPYPAMQLGLSVPLLTFVAVPHETRDGTS